MAVDIFPPYRKDVKEQAIMKNSYTAVIKQDGDDWIGWIEKIPGV
jgi:hypothetical protein